MGKSSAKQLVTNYYMSLHYGIASGPVDTLRRLTVNGKVMWQGTVTSPQGININKPDLFGGVKKEGGVVGQAYYLPGRSNQTMPEHLAARSGRTTATSPGYRGLTSIFFVGKATAYDAAYGGGFLWSSNNPLIAQTITATVTRSPKGLETTMALIANPDAPDAPDANPAHMIYECLTNTDWGLGLPASLIDRPSFITCATTLFAEGFGLSMIWTKQATVQDFISEIIDHIQATFFIHPRTGLYTLKLFRDDYDVSTLRRINPDNADLSGFQRKMWGETVNEIAVTWTNPANEEEETVVVQNLSLVEKQGAPAPDSRNYYGIRYSGLAMRVAERDLRSASSPLAAGEGLLDRTFWDTLPGEVLILDWPEYDIADLIVRVVDADYGKIGDSKIKVTLLEDIFSLEHPISDIQPGTGWIEPGEEPAPMAQVEIITLPMFLSSSVLLETDARTLVYPEVVAAILAWQPGFDTDTFDLMSEQPLPNGEVSFQLAGAKTTLDRILLVHAMAAEPSSVLALENLSGVQIGPEVGGFAFIGTGGDAGMEVALVDSYDGLDWTLNRGVLDTVPRAWPIGTPMWFVGAGKKISDDQDSRAAGESPEFKLLSRTSLGVLDASLAPIETGTLTARPHLPLRPANVKVNATGFGAVAIGGSANIAITWSTRNRLLEDGQVVRWNAGSVAPEYAQETVVTVFDQGGAQVYEQGGLWTESGLTLPAAWFARYSALTIRVASRRTGLWSLQAHSIAVTGLPADAGAALPPEPPPVLPPPSPVAAPAEDAFQVVTGTVTGEDGSKVPGLIIFGSPDNANATGLVARYHKATGAVDYVFHPTVDLRAATEIRIILAPLAGLTPYVVDVAYQVDGAPLGEWRTLEPNPITTEASVAGDVATIGGRTPEEIFADINFNAEAIIQALLAAEGVKTTLEKLGAADGLNEAFVLAINAIKVSPTETFAQRLEYIKSQVGDGYASVGFLREAINGALARATLQLDVNGHVVGWVIANDGTLGDMNILVDNFGVVSADDPENPIKVFEINTALGKVRFRADVEIDGNLLVHGSVDTPSLAPNAAAVPTISKGVSAVFCDGTEKVFLEHTVILTRDAMVTADVNMASNFPSGDRTWEAKLYIDGEMEYRIGGANGEASMPMSGARACAAGAITITVTLNSHSSVNVTHKILSSLVVY